AFCSTRASAPWKSKRLLISLLVCSTAFFTSCSFTCETMSNDGMRDLLRHMMPWCNRVGRQGAFHGQKRAAQDLTRHAHGPPAAHLLAADRARRLRGQRRGARAARD